MFVEAASAVGVFYIARFMTEAAINRTVEIMEEWSFDDEIIDEDAWGKE